MTKTDEKLREASHRARSASGRPAEWAEAWRDQQKRIEAQAFRDQQARKAAQEPAQGPPAFSGYVAPSATKEPPQGAFRAQQSGFSRAMSVMQVAAAEIDTCHAALDAAATPQRDTLAERVQWLCDSRDGAGDVQVTAAWFDGDHPNSLHPVGLMIDPRSRTVHVPVGWWIREARAGNGGKS